MIKNLIGGILIGIANIIPGVSGGTIIVILGLFDKVMNSISTLFKIKVSFKERLKCLTFLMQIGIGLVIGLVGFAKVLEFLFVKFEMQTLFFFAGLIIASVPMLKKQEMDNSKIKPIYFILGILLIGIIAFLNPGESGNIVKLETLLNTKLGLTYLLSLIGIGAISGATMIFPGISGSMVLLVIGKYHLFKGYVANLTTFELNILIPLVFIAIGVGLGIILSAKITSYLLKNFKQNTMSFIIGLIIMSSIIILPTNGYSLINTLSSTLMFIIGCILIVVFEKVKNKKRA
ncbi:MAG: DUF368 domain-containing protein [Firmicutes bacterium]|nr:DUF368 domain-containing protein [Bacillota bacterium]